MMQNFLKRLLPWPPPPIVTATVPKRPELKAVGLTDFLGLDLPPRAMLLDPILPERSLAMLYAPRGLGRVGSVFRLD